MAWQMDSGHSQVRFSVKHIMIARVHGSFQEFSASVQLDDSDLSKSEVQWTIQTASLTTHNAQRDHDLKSPLFFDVEQYPTIRFQSTTVAATGKDRYNVSGDVTIKDVTRQETFEVEAEGPGQDMRGNRRWGFTVTGALSRKEYGLSWNAALETGGVVIGDTVKVELDVEVMQLAAVGAPA